MREIAYKNLTSSKHRRRVFSVMEKTQQKDCTTTTHKSFIYVVDKEGGKQKVLREPAFHITKIFNSKTHTEKFLFRVKGMLYVTRDRHQFLVRYCHSLKIDVVWKTKIPSSEPAS